MHLKMQLPPILLSYATSESLGILEFKVPNPVATTQSLQLDNLSVPSPPSQAA